MEDRQLNFSAPLLSARRFTIVKLPLDTIESEKVFESTEANLDDLKKPAAVPFRWEKIPGLPKDGSKLRSLSCELAPRIPRTESRKIFDVLKQRVEKKNSQRTFQRSSTVVDSYKLRMESKEKMACGKVFPSCQEDEEKNEDEVYSEANDTISIAEALSLICSASGVSNYETAIVKNSGTFSTDKQVQDFMMSRFLPAAKAMAFQPTPSASKKLPAVVEQERQVSRVMSLERKTTAKFVESILASSKVEDDLEDDDSSTSAQMNTKACGFLPRICLKGSLSFINPIPGLKLKCKPSRPPSPEPVKPIKEIKRSVSPFKKLENFPLQSPQLLDDSKNLKFGSNQFHFSGERPSMSRTSSPLRRSGVLSPRRSRSPQRPMRIDSSSDYESSRPNRIPAYRGGIKSQDLSTHPMTKQWSCPLIPAIEKTLYIDGGTKPEKLQQASGKNLNGGWRSREFPVGKKPFEDTNLEKHRNMFRSRELVKCPEDQFADFSMALVPISTGKSNDYDYLTEDNDWSKKNNDFGAIVATPAPPRLPKSPSESWLWRTLPSMPPRHSFNQVSAKSIPTKWEDPIASPEEVKWENIVKSAYLYRDRARFSEELVLSASRQFK